ncbi:MAG: 50S ribosomal protein L29 [Candidatus Bathyarchaeia archaeon]|nr:50S ribosomal protein L29 [Candidatus Bathyarchaeota archaeon]
MAILRMREIKEMSSENRLKKIEELKVELMRLKTMSKAGGAIENPAKIKEIKRTIARLLTVENEVKRRS